MKNQNQNSLLEIRQIDNFSPGTVTWGGLVQEGSITGILAELKWGKDDRLILFNKGLKGKARITSDDLIKKDRLVQQRR